MPQGEVLCFAAKDSSGRDESQTRTPRSLVLRSALLTAGAESAASLCSRKGGCRGGLGCFSDLQPELSEETG